MKILILDTNSVMYRAWAVRKNREDCNSYQIGVFIAMFNKAKKLFNPDLVLCAFDCKGSKNKRKELYDNYKGDRPQIEDSYIIYGEQVKKWLTSENITWLQKEEFEADDICGCWSEKYKQDKNNHIDIITGDKDLLQLTDTNVTVYIMKSGISKMVEYTPDTIDNKYKIPAKEVLFYKCLAGDKSDNIESIYKPSKARKLIEQYRTLDNYYNSQYESEELQKKVKLIESIVTIRRDWKELERKVDQ